MKTFVTKINDEGIDFDNGSNLSSYHDAECCEHHWLSFEHLTLDDFEGLEFDLSNDGFFERIPGYGIALLPLNGHPVRIPGYGSNNGYYSDNLDLVLKNEGKRVFYNISNCQIISD
jgi:hypothetical protein